MSRQDGSRENCRKQEGAKYVQCTQSNCVTLQPCPDVESQIDCTTRWRNNETAQAICHDNVKWCAQYTVETTTADQVLGYIPRSYSCINALGQPAQHPEQVLVAGSIQLGDCTCQDGTLVNNTLVGNFASCGGNDNNNVTCDHAFLGVYRSRDYDPRVRGWYVLARKLQTTVWSDPYPFFSNLEVGVTYSHPIYTRLAEPGGGRTKFEGVIAVDYSLNVVANFLKTNYPGTDMSVLIVEAAEPHHVVAASTGTPAAKTVLSANHSVPCPDSSVSSDCEAIRIPIAEFGGTAHDVVLRRAFAAQKDVDFPSTELVNLKSSDQVGANAFISQGSIYEQENANLRWRVFVVMPMDRSTTDFVVRGDPVFNVVCVLSCFGFVATLVMLLKLFSKRKTNAVIHADWRFTCAFIVGCVSLNLTNFALLGENTDATCMVRMWSFNLFFASGTCSSGLVFCLSIGIASFSKTLDFCSPLAAVCQGVANVPADHRQRWISSNYNHAFQSLSLLAAHYFCRVCPAPCVLFCGSSSSGRRPWCWSRLWYTNHHMQAQDG